MDKKIKQLIYLISQKYNITLTTIMRYNDEKRFVTTTYKVNITVKNSNNTRGKTLLTESYFNKQKVLLELVKWID